MERGKVCLMLIFIWLGDMKSTKAINILGIVTSLSKSHAVFANSILNEYANNGHSVTLLSAYEVSPRINHFYLEGLDRLKKQFNSNWNIHSDEYSAMLQLHEEGVAVTTSVINHKSFRKLLASSLNIDVIIFDYDLNDAILGIISQHFKCPVLVLSSSLTLKLSLKRSLGLSYPLINLIFNGPAVGWASALWKIASNLYEEFVVDFYFNNQQTLLYNEVVGTSAEDLKEISSKSIAKIFTNSLSRPFLIPADAIDVSALHIPLKCIFDYSVSKSLDEFIHSSEDGCIYVSLGADIDPATLPKGKISKIFEALNNRPEKIIWAWNGNASIFEKSNKFYIEKWLPQDDILRHRNIKAFVTSGGILSLQEAIYHEVPVIGIPLTHEQSANVNYVIDSGLGVKVAFDNITIESLTWSLSAVLEQNSFSYRQRLAVASDLMKSRPLSPMQTVQYWIDHLYQHRHEGFIATSKISTIGYYLNDVYLVAILFLAVTSLVGAILCNKLWKSTRQALDDRKFKLL